MNWPNDNQAELVAFYGNPGFTQRELVIWESANLVYVPVPWKMVLAWDQKIVVPSIRCHKKISESLFRILNDVWVNVAKESQAEIEKMKVHLYGGGYMARLIRGGKRRSTHGFGCGIDWNPAENRMHTKGNMDPRFRACFEKEGAVWLKHDQMHVQWAKSPKAMPRVVQPIKATTPKPKPVPDIAPAPMPLKGDTTKWIAAAAPLIKRWEGFRATPYWDVHQWAIGYGQKCEKDTPPITEERASAMLMVYLMDLSDKVAPLVKVSVTANQGAALLSFAYNLGHGALAKSTLLKKLNAGDYEGAAGQFGKWVKAGGKKLPGLVKRREAERVLFLS